MKRRVLPNGSSNVLIFNGEADAGYQDPYRLAVFGVQDAGCVALPFRDPVRALDFARSHPDFGALITSLDVRLFSYSGGGQYPGSRLIEQARLLGNAPVALFRDSRFAAGTALEQPDLHLLPAEPGQIQPAVTAWLGEVSLPLQ